MVHVGYYDKSIGEGLYETHLNYFVAAQDAKEAKNKTHQISEFQERSMHIDGMKEISSVEGYKVTLEKDSESKSGEVISYDETKNL
tara:strand:+ start:851 stop:1108 length:258 start_codon:yes stop_codon:yes gene_type:complete